MSTSIHTSVAAPISPEVVLLGLLAGGPGHGYDLHQRLTRDLGLIWRVSQSQAYNILTRLEHRGLIAATVQAQSKLPARRLLRLTAAGRRRFEAWLAQPCGGSVKSIRVEFLTRLYFARLRGPVQETRIIKAQIDLTRADLARLQALELPDEQVINRMGLDLRIRQLTSVLDWLVDCQTTLTPARLG